MFSYLDVSQFDGTSASYDHFSNVTLIFELDYYEPDQGRIYKIKDYGVFPAYAIASGLKLVSNSRNKVFKWEFITQISDIESQSGGIGGSDSQNEDDQKQLLPAL